MTENTKVYKHLQPCCLLELAKLQEDTEVHVKMELHVILSLT